MTRPVTSSTKTSLERIAILPRELFLKVLTYS